MTQPETLLITGANSPLAHALVKDLAQDYPLIGADLTPPDDAYPFPGEFYRLDYTKARFGELFSQHRISCIIHVGRIKPTLPMGTSQRFKQNVLGTKAILHTGAKHGVRQFIVLSSHQVYGAYQDNPLYIPEDQTLRAHAKIRELSDAVELDHESREFMWRYPKLHTTILRPVHIVGADISGPLMSAMRSPVSPLLLGYNPLMQFIHQSDVAHAIRCVLARPKRGVYNLAGEGGIPYSKALSLAGSRPIPVPSGIFPYLFRMMGFQLPHHFLDYLKFPIVVDDQRFRKAFGFKQKLSILKTFDSLGS